MRKLIFIGLVIFCAIYWHEITALVKANAPIVNNNITQWFVDHTPKH